MAGGVWAGLGLSRHQVRCRPIDVTADYRTGEVAGNVED